MSELQSSTRSYLAALALATAGVTVVALLRTAAPGLDDVLLAIALCALQVAAVSFPLELAPQQKFSLHTAVIFAAVLLFDPGTAVLIAGVGTAIGQIVRQQPGDQVLFNACQTALQAGVAGLVLTMFDRPDGIVDFERVESIAGILAAAVVIYVIDVVAVEIVVRLETEQPLRSILREMPAGSLLDDVSLIAFGLLAAITINAHDWTLPVLALLAFQMHRVARRSLAAQQDERRLRAESERTSIARHEFLLTASHELKTPITTVKMAAQLLDRALVQREPAFQIDEEGILRWRDQLMLGIERLENLVADLLDAARIQQGRLELHPADVDLVELARAVVERFEYSAERTDRHQLLLAAPDHIDGYWDPSGIDQVLTNLVSNALKYSPDGGVVSIQIEEDGDNARLSVTDDGIGISTEQQTELFKPFARGLTVQHGISGTGLGLYISKRVIEQHGGTIELESIPGIGTTITVIIPRASPVLAASATAGIKEPTAVAP